MEETDKMSLEQQLAEAEERGYKRGLNEQLTKQMEAPGQWEGDATPDAEATEPPCPILNNRRPSIWDAQ